MKDVIKTKCPYYNKCDNYVNYGRDNEWCVIKEKRTCINCYHQISEIPRKTYPKVKEKAVTNHIRKKFAKYNWDCDKIIQGATNQNRPDMITTNDNGSIFIVEIDEGSHKCYKKDDIERLYKIHEDLKKEPTYVFRFNPDNYRKKGERVTSPWRKNKDKQPVVDNPEDWDYRLKTLSDIIAKPKIRKQLLRDKIIEKEIINGNMHVYYLFYDSGHVK